MQRWAQLRTELVWTGQKQKILRRGGKNTQKNCTEKIFDNPYSHDAVNTHLEPEILNAKASVPHEAPQQIKLVEVMELQLSYFKS